MLSLQTYGLKIHYNISVEGRVTWIDGHILGYGNKQFSVARFRSMIHELISQTKRLLLQDLLLLDDNSAVPMIPWDALRETRAGACFKIVAIPGP